MSWADLAPLSRSISTWLSDYGTEIGLAKVMPVLIKDLLPYWAAPEEEGTRGMDEEVEFAEGCIAEQSDIEVDFGASQPEPVPAPAADLSVDVRRSLEVPGVLHIISNAGNSLESTMDGYKDAVTKLIKVSNLLSRRESKERLYETCYADTPEGRELFRPLWQFRANCHSERWGTVSHCVCTLVREAAPSLRAACGWNLDKYLYAPAHPRIDRGRV